MSPATGTGQWTCLNCTQRDLCDPCPKTRQRSAYRLPGHDLATEGTARVRDGPAFRRPGCGPGAVRGQRTGYRSAGGGRRRAAHAGAECRQRQQCVGAAGNRRGRRRRPAPGCRVGRGRLPVGQAVRRRPFESAGAPVSGSFAGAFFVVLRAVFFAAVRLAAGFLAGALVAGELLLVFAAGTFLAGDLRAGLPPADSAGSPRRRLASSTLRRSASIRSTTSPGAGVAASSRTGRPAALASMTSISASR